VSFILLTGLVTYEQLFLIFYKNKRKLVFILH